MDFQKLIQPVPRSAVFSLRDYFVWCGTLTRSDDGLYHLFYSRWKKEYGFNAWVSHSEIAHAIAKSPLGPFKHQDVMLPPRGEKYWDGLCTHNPTVQRFGKKYYLYYMGNTGDARVEKGLNWTHRNNQRIGVAVADDPNGPWQRFDAPLIDTTPGFYDALCCANPSVTERPEGGYLMVYKAVSNRDPLPFGGPVTHVAAIADGPMGPFKKQSAPVFHKEGAKFAAEDPFIWTQKGQYFALVKDMGGFFTSAGRSLALFESKNGLNWDLSSNPLVSKTEFQWEDGIIEDLHALERPQLWIENGILKVFLCAAQTKDQKSTFNVQIPLAVI